MVNGGLFTRRSHSVGGVGLKTTDGQTDRKVTGHVAIAL